MRAPHKTTGPDCLPLEANCQECALRGGELAGGVPTGYKSIAVADEVATGKCMRARFPPGRRQIRYLALHLRLRSVEDLSRVNT